MKLHRIIAALLCAAMLVAMCPQVLPLEAQAATITASGTCGTSLTWTLDDSGTLTISGTGAMADYSAPGQVPWNSSRSAVKKVVIESGITGISAYAFSNCTGLTDIAIPEGVTSIGASAFDGCTGLTGIILPDSLVSIGDYAFYICSGMTSVTVPDGVTGIGAYAFYGCSGLTSLTIGAGVTGIGDSAFRDCSGLEKIHFNAAAMNDLSDSNGMFYNAGKDGGGITVHIGASVTRIPAYLLYPDPWSEYPPNVTEIMFAEGSACESIGAYAFRKCTALTSVTLDKSVASIGNFAFTGCTGLTDVHYNGTQEQKAAITIGGGNDPLKNATWYYTVLATQEDLQQVLDSAESGTTVVLTQDAELGSVAVWEGVTLNLNGYTLTVNYFTCYGAVADSGDGGNALIKVNKNIHIAGHNSFLPIYDSADGGYRFYKYQLQNLGYKTVEDDPNTLKAGIRLVLNNTAGYDVLSGTADAAMDAMAYISWGNMPGAICYQFSDDTLRSYAAQAAADIAANGTTSKAITLTIRGIDKLGADASISVQPAMTTAPGVSAQGQTANWTAQ